MNKTIKITIIFLTVIALFICANPVRIHADSYDQTEDFSVDYGNFVFEDSGWYIDNNSIVYVSQEEEVRQISENEKEMKKDISCYLIKEGFSASDIVRQVNRSGQGQSYLDEWDSTYSVKIYATLYYTHYTSNQTVYYKIDKAEGGTVVADIWVTVPSKRVVLTCEDDNHPNQSLTAFPAGSTWTVNYSTCSYINSSHSSAVFGLVYRATIERPNGYQWEVVLRDHHLGGVLEEY